MTDPEMHILKTAICDSLTGKSTLTYQIGTLPDSTLHVRITKNTGAGFFNGEWIALEDIHRKLETANPVTSIALQPLFKGRSTNTPGFLLAVLVHERLLRPLKGKKRGHEFLDPDGFDAKMKKLVASKARPRGVTSNTKKKSVTRKTPSKKAAVKKNAVSRRKTAKTV